MPAEVPSDHDDNCRGALWRITAGVDDRCRFGNAAPPGDQYCGWLDGEPSPHSLYDAGYLFIYGPAAIVPEGAQRRENPTTPNNSSPGIYLRATAHLDFV